METVKIKWGNHLSEWYKPRKNKVKVGLVGGFVIALLITPFTNWLLIPLGRALNKNPLWVFR